MKIPKTQQKLAEAEFFLGHMEQQAHKSLNPPLDRRWEVFQYYLSAFLSAARSVTYVLEKEAKEVYVVTEAGWNAALAMEDSALWKFMKAQRVAEVHLLGAEYQRDTGFVPITEVQHTNAGPVHLYIGWFGDDFSPLPRVAVLAPKFVIDGQPSEVVAKCRRYVELLGERIRACEQAEQPRSGEGPETKPPGPLGGEGINESRRLGSSPGPFENHSA